MSTIGLSVFFRSYTHPKAFKLQGPAPSAGHFPPFFYALGRVPARNFSKTPVLGSTTPEAEAGTRRERNLTLPLSGAAAATTNDQDKASPILARSLLTLTFYSYPFHCDLSRAIVPTERNLIPRDTNLRCENKVSHRDGLFDNDYHAREFKFTAKILKADMMTSARPRPPA
jgi:hypothetical protein